jgi:hypothetical protein
MNDKIKQKSTEWRQHIDRMNNERLTKQIREYNPRGRRSVGRPRRRWSELEGWCISSEQASMPNPWSEEEENSTIFLIWCGRQCSLKLLVISARRICKTAVTFGGSYFSRIEHFLLITKRCALSFSFFIQANQHNTVFRWCHPRFLRCACNRYKWTKWNA